MNSEIFTFFSSDSDELYKADIFRALALPRGYVIQFRYPIEFIDPKFRTDLAGFIGKKGCIFFVGGNNQALPANKRSHQIFSVCEVTVRQVLPDDDDTKQVYFLLELGEFSNYSCPSGELQQLAADEFFVSKVKAELGEKTSWSDRVATVAGFFPDHLFLGIKAISKGNTVQKPKFDQSGRASYYKLREESDYECQIQFYDTAGGTSVLKTETFFENLSISLPAKFIVGTRIDRVLFGIQTGSLTRRREPATIRFLQKDRSPVHRVDLAFRVTRDYLNAIFFGLFTALAGLGLLLGQIASKPIGKLNIMSWNGLVGLAAVVSVGTGAAFLYHLFNKK